MARMILFTRMMGVKSYPFPLLLPSENLGVIVHSLFLDNGAYGFYINGEYPPLDKWARMVLAAARRLAGKARVAKLAVLPDYPLDGEWTIEAAKRLGWLAEELHSLGFTVLAVAHQLRIVGGFMESARRLLELDYVDGVAAPLKLTCARGGRASQSCQLEVARQVAAACREAGCRWLHGLGSLLSRNVVARLAELGYTSIDSTSWTRPVADHCIERCGLPRRRSARTARERECLLNCALEYLGEWLIQPKEIIPCKYDRASQR